MEKQGYAPNFNANHRSLEGEMDSAKELMAECQRLRDEIGRLRQILIDNDVDPDPVSPKRAAPAPSNLPSVSLTRISHRGM